MTTTTTTNKTIQKLQRAIVDGLEDVKAQNIVVFDTTHLSSLFERVIIASGTSNRQTKALAGSVRDAVREAGFAKPRIEGETNGEWIIVDCGQAVVHIMQPNFRVYYNLEELWGDKPVRLKFGAVKPESKAPAKVVAAEPPAKPASLKRSNAAKKGVQEAFPSKAQVRKTLAAKTVRSKTAASKTVASKAPAKTVTAKKVVVGASAKPAAKKVAAKKPATRRT